MSQTNKSLHKKLDSKLKESYLHPGLLLFNPCNLHKCHNAFHKGITIYGKDSENLTFELHAWCKISHCKERTSFKLPSNCKAWSIFPRTKHFSTVMLKQDVFFSYNNDLHLRTKRAKIIK